MLAMCLHSVGYNGDAEELLRAQAARLEADLPSVQLALRDLLLARVLDCTSKYDDSVRAATQARRRVREGPSGPPVDQPARRALLIRARYQIAQSRQQSIGPMIALGDPRVDCDRRAGCCSGR